MKAPQVTLSHFLRHSGEVLAAVEDADVSLARRDGPDLVLTTGPRAQTIRDGTMAIARLVLAALDSPDAASGIARHLSAAVPGASALRHHERLRFLREIAEGVAAAVELGTVEPLARALDSLRRVARLRAETPPTSGHVTRSVSIPDDVDDAAIQKASGVIELPLHVRWAHPLRTYDLDDARQRRLAYEQVLTEGLDDDVRAIIDVEILANDWSHLVLPSRVRRAWADWFLRRRGITLAC